MSDDDDDESDDDLPDGESHNGTAPPVGRHPLPEVPRFSSMINFLDLCQIGTRFFIDALDDYIFLDNFGWMVEGTADDTYTAYDIVEHIRHHIAKDDASINLDACYLHLVPADSLRIKKEIMAEAGEESDDGPAATGMEVCTIDLTSDDAAWLETATNDGSHVPQQVCRFAEPFATSLSMRQPVAILHRRFRCR